MSGSSIDRRIAAGELEVVVSSVYRVYDSPEHPDLIQGALLALPNAVASHQSAAHLLAFPRLPSLVPTVTVPSHTTHVYPGIIVRRCTDMQRSDITTVNGIRSTTVARTAFDLSGVLEYSLFDEIVEALLVAGRLELRHLERVLARLGRKGKPGTRPVRDFISLRAGIDPKATKLEIKGRAVLARRGVPTPVPQFPLPWDESRRFDDAYPDAMVAIEWDSRLWHLRQQAMTDDRRRDRMAARQGWVVLRFTWEDVTERPDEIADTVAVVLAARRNIASQPK
jgi:hypothetical protein